MHNEILRKSLTKCNGYESSFDDCNSFLVSFADLDSAIKWCTDVQTTLSHSTWPATLKYETEWKKKKEKKKEIKKKKIVERSNCNSFLVSFADLDSAINGALMHKLSSHSTWPAILWSMKKEAKESKQKRKCFPSFCTSNLLLLF